MLTAKTQYRTERLDHLGIVSGICQEIRLAEVIDNQIGGNGRQVSVGQAIQAMILNGLGFASRALYLTPEFFNNKPVDLLIREGVTAEMLNDNSLGDALDRMYEAGVTELFAQVAARACDHYGIKTRFHHLDSSIWSFEFSAHFRILHQICLCLESLVLRQTASRTYGRRPWCVLLSASADLQVSYP